MEPRVSGSRDTASPSSVTTLITPPSAAMPAGATTRIIWLETISKSVTLTPFGNSIERAVAKPLPLMVIGWPATTLVGKNTLMPSPASAVSSSGSISRLQAEMLPSRATDRSMLKYLNIFFISVILIKRSTSPGFA